MESSRKGWIKLHRNLLYDQIWTSSEPFSKRDAWIDLLLNAAYKKEKEKEDGKDIDILPGQILTSFLALSRRWRWSRDKVRSFLRQCPHIRIDRVNRQTGKCLITIENWDVYQSTKGSNRHTKSTTKSTPRSIYKEEETLNGMEQQVTAPAEEDDDDGMTIEEYRIWVSTNSTEQMQNDSLANAI
jgi:hypothetical protein